MLKELFDVMLASRRVRRKVSMSMLGHCQRQLAYQIHNWSVSNKLDAVSLLRMEYGTAIHRHFQRLFKHHARQLPGFGSFEKKVTLILGNHVVKGRIDGRTKDTVVDFKTASPIGFEEFKSGKIPHDYLYQMQGYLAAEGLDRGLFLVLDKSGLFNRRPSDSLRTFDDLIAEVAIYYDPKITDDIRHKLDRLGSSKAAEDVAKDFGPDSSGRLPWQCCYCPFLGHCWPTAKETSKNKWEVPNDTGNAVSV